MRTFPETESLVRDILERSFRRGAPPPGGRGDGPAGGAANALPRDPAALKWVDGRGAAPQDDAGGAGARGGGRRAPGVWRAAGLGDAGVLEERDLQALFREPEPA